MKRQFEKDPFNEHQNFLYNRALYGLSVYSQEEINEMPFEKKKRVTKLHKKAQTLINLWKQEIVNTLANRFFTDIFPDMEITKCLVQYGTEGDPEYYNNMSFKMLRITKKQVIDKLIEGKILPKNFYELNQHESRNSMQRRSVSHDMSGESYGRRDPEESSKTRKRHHSNKINSGDPKQVIQQRTINK